MSTDTGTTDIQDLSGNGGGVAFVNENWVFNTDTFEDARRYGLFGGNRDYDGEHFQNALNQVPLGSNLVLPHGRIYIPDTVIVRREVNLIFQSDTIILGIIDDPTKDVISVKIEEAGNENQDCRNMIWWNARIQAADGTQHRYALNIETVEATDDLPNLGMLFLNPMFYAPSTATGALRIHGLRNHLHKFIGGDVTGKIALDECSDGMKFIGQHLRGVGGAFEINLQPGAFQTVIDNCICNNRDGFIDLINASELYVTNNQVEQEINSGPNQSTFSAAVTIRPTNKPLRSLNFEKNNFGGGRDTSGEGGANNYLNYQFYVDPAVGASVEALKIRNNILNETQTGVDIVLNNERVIGADIADNELRGDRLTSTFSVYPLMTTNTLDKNKMIAVTDNGKGTRGVRKHASAMGAGSDTTLIELGWSTTTDMFFEKDSKDELTFQGLVTGPNIAQSEKVIGQLPLGFRPASTERVTLYGFNLSDGTKQTVYCDIEPVNGYISMTYAAPSSGGQLAIGMSPIRFIAKYEDYQPGY